MNLDFSVGLQTYTIVYISIVKQALCLKIYAQLFSHRSICSSSTHLGLFPTLSHLIPSEINLNAPQYPKFQYALSLLRSKQVSTPSERVSTQSDVSYWCDLLVAPYQIDCTLKPSRFVNVIVPLHSYRGLFLRVKEAY